MSQSPLIIAHRGYRAKYPENTLSAFKAAIEAYADGVEFDVWLSKDRQIVVTHDLEIAHHSDGRGKTWDLSLNQLRDYNFAHKHGGAQKIPTLLEVLDLCQGMKLINIEVKTYHLQSKNIEVVLNEQIAKLPYLDQIIVSSFNPKVLLMLKSINPKIGRALLLQKRQLPKLSLPALNRLIKPIAINPPDYCLNAALVHKAKRAGQKIYPWTVNSLEFLKKCVQLGVDGIITDDPIWARENLVV